MSTAAVERPEPLPELEHDNVVVLRDVSWEQFETILAIRGDAAGVRLTYLDGELELMSPSLRHEQIAALIGRLVEVYALERYLPCTGCGSWTLRKKVKKAGIEPDRCWVLTEDPDPKRPDLAIEVFWRHGTLRKLEAYRRLGVPEVWVWKGGELAVFALAGRAYVEAPRSRVLPDLDLDLLVSFLDEPFHTRAAVAFLSALRAPPTS